MRAWRQHAGWRLCARGVAGSDTPAQAIGVDSGLPQETASDNCHYVWVLC